MHLRRQNPNIPLTTHQKEPPRQLKITAKSRSLRITLMRSDPLEEIIRDLMIGIRNTSFFSAPEAEEQASPIRPRDNRQIDGR